MFSQCLFVQESRDNRDKPGWSTAQIAFNWNDFFLVLSRLHASLFQEKIRADSSEIYWAFAGFAPGCSPSKPVFVLEAKLDVRAWS